MPAYSAAVVKPTSRTGYEDNAELAEQMDLVVTNVLTALRTSASTGAFADPALGRAEDEFVRGEDNLPAWVAFFGAADLSALTGMVHSLLSGGTNEQKAISCLTTSISSRTSSATRSTIFELTALATTKLNAGDYTGGVQNGNQAVDLAEQVRSLRTIDRLTPLRQAAQNHPSDQGATGLATRIATLQRG